MNLKAPTWVEIPECSSLVGKHGLSLDFYKIIPGIFKPDPGKFLVVPVPLIFGSEELSSNSKPLSQLIPEPFVLINEKDIKTLRITENDMIKLVVDQISIIAKIKIENSLPDGIAAMSVITPGMAFIDLPGWGRIENA